MAADAWKIYDKLKLFVLNGTIDLDTDTIKVALFLSTSNCASLTHDELGDLTNQHANANGYTTGGVTVTPSLAQVTSTTTYDATDAVFTASGGNIVARFAVLYANVTRNGVTNPLIGFTLMDNAPADVTITPPNTLTIATPAGGVFALAGGT